jgi:uncharacterized membrane protein
MQQPGGSQTPPMQQPGGTQRPPTQQPGGTSTPPMQQPGGTTAPPMQHPGPIDRQPVQQTSPMDRAARGKNTVYHIVLFSFRGSKRAEDILSDVKMGQRISGYRIAAQAVVERDMAGKVHIHEPGRGGVGGAAGAVAGGLLGLFGGPLAVVVLAIAGGAAGGIAGHFAGRAIPAEDLKRMGNALPPDSSGLVVLVEDTEAERMIDEMGAYSTEVVRVTVGDELAGEIDSVIAARSGVSTEQGQGHDSAIAAQKERAE